jgi:bis(5'-nucleosidyl)-tetraphosphatase
MTDSEREPKEREESFGVIVFRNNSPAQEVLLVKEPDGHWGFPKGHVELGEDGLTTAIREAKEETDISVVVNDPSIFYTEAYEIRRDRFTTKKTVTYFVGEGDGEPNPKDSEILEARWVSIEEALKLLTYQSAKNILKVAHSSYT